MARPVRAATRLAPAVPPGRGRPRTAGLREAILAEAERVFARHDFHEVLMEDVARGSGVGKGTLYRYFPSKDALYHAVMVQDVERLHAELRGALGASGSPVGRLRRIARGILAHFWERQLFLLAPHRHEPRMREADPLGWKRRREELRSIVRRAIEEGIEAGELRPVPARIAAEGLLGMLRGVSRFRERRDTLDEVERVALEIFLAGAGTPAGRRAWLAARRTGR